jgi:hypothetical protein
MRIRFEKQATAEVAAKQLGGEVTEGFNHPSLGIQYFECRFSPTKKDVVDILNIEATGRVFVRSIHEETDFKVLRRRIEDALRKTATKEEIVAIAGLLGVKTD